MKDFADDQQLSITESIRELWDRANHAVTTSQKLQAIDPEMARRWQEMKAKGMRDDEIIARLDRMEKRQGSGGKVWAWFKGAIKHAAETADKIRIE